MQFLDENGQLVGEEELCPDCGRAMLQMPFVATGCSPADYAMCNAKLRTKHEIKLPKDHSEMAIIELPDEGPTVSVYWHQPALPEDPGYLVIDVDTFNESDDGGSPMRVYRNDAPVYQED